jgi:ABC-type multidrug transport system ATPase subunit
MVRKREMLSPVFLFNANCLNASLPLIEPTTGLDPLSRRRVWETVLWMKRQGCVIILTTHNMEEADFLSDTIMIMHNGHGKS